MNDAESGNSIKMLWLLQLKIRCIKFLPHVYGFYRYNLSITRRWDTTALYSSIP